MDEQTLQRSLADDLLSGISAIAAYTGEDQRRVRHLIKAHGFPHIKRGGRIYSCRSWADAYFGKDNPQEPSS